LLFVFIFYGSLILY